MSKLTVTVPSPGDVVDAASLNSLFTSIASASINDENLATGALEWRHFVDNPVFVFQGIQHNDASVSLGSHSPNTFTAFSNGGHAYHTLDYGAGTRLLVGEDVSTGDFMVIDYAVTVWEVDQSESLGKMAGAVIHNQTFGGNEGSGYGEWCWFLYPVVNTISSVVGSDSFKDVATLTTGWSSVSDMTGGRSSVVHVEELPQVAPIPTHYLQSTDTSGEMSAARYARGDRYSLSYNNIMFRPRTIRGQVSIPITVSAHIYSLELRVGGYYRLDYRGGHLLWFLEDQVCDPNSGQYGVSESLSFERAVIGARIFTNVTV